MGAHPYQRQVGHWGGGEHRELPLRAAIVPGRNGLGAGATIRSGTLRSAPCTGAEVGGCGRGLACVSGEQGHVHSHALAPDKTPNTNDDACNASKLLHHQLPLLP